MGGRKPLELFGTNIALAVVSGVEADCRNLITFLSTNIFETHWLSLWLAGVSLTLTGWL